MFRKKPLLLFLIKATLIYIVLSLPISAYDEIYGNFYRSCSKLFFQKINGTGFALFAAEDVSYKTQINIGNYALVRPDGKTETAKADLNTRFRGYLPTILLLALVVATPLTLKRKLISLIAGLILVTGMIMLKQWIHIMFLCGTNRWLMLYNFSDSNQKKIEFIYDRYVTSISPALFLVVIIWILVSFRKDDLKIFINQVQRKKS